jgi:ABC-type tungstate transport system permease subunit/ABC-type tungstate transport system substrate-binding protein
MNVLQKYFFNPRPLRTVLITLTLLFLVCSSFYLFSCRNRKELIMASTTSTQDSGLFDALLPVFEQNSGYQVKVIAVGTGEAIELGKKGEADIIFVHSRKAEDEFVMEGWGLERKDVMYNDFVILGPEEDPAAIASAAGAVEAFMNIAQSGATFVSRADNSGTHKKEEALWSSSGTTPFADQYIETGQGMGESLRIADEKQAYILSDRGTWLAQRETFSLRLLYEGDDSLFNPYGIIAVNPDRHPDIDIDHEGAILFIDWITSEEAQDIIRLFGIEEYGEPLFYPDAKGKLVMRLIFEGIIEAFMLIFAGDREILEIIFLTLYVSGAAVLISMVLGLPLGLFIGLNNFRAKRFVVSIINTGMGLPPVAAGLFISLMLWRSGPLGFMSLMYTPAAMIIAQVLIATPIISGVTLAAVQQINPSLKLQALSLGASRVQVLWLMAKEAKLPSLAAIMAGFGGVISEVGAVLMVGGNIRGQTRVLTTATVQMVRMGQMSSAIALVIILLALSFIVNMVLTLIQQKEDGTWMRRFWR